ncbi:uncharacterized protein BDZ99DRAFT_465149 [Mytilinidion resinicola]|uniref:Uncharacterized protein n=1 Tax=Mytilinidion resinicola TaxID=574789 RepID=A0A6A6YER4_9PEZI|nr:uncharacterized protein BDZ99DRAFT_465149 [Mytilinidion resinicola]KAF2807230.1 hypothetical protein BDZ99DRAFT_465149 [Mytilinidion resinicola]
MIPRIRKQLKRRSFLGSKNPPSTARNSLDPITPSPLLSLPREIRDTILELVISSSRAPPQDTSEAEPRSPSATEWQAEEISGFDAWYHSRTPLYFEPRVYISNSAPLLLVNHQVSSETAAALARLNLPYELDVIFSNENSLWPSWLSVPRLSNQLDQVNVTFRICGSEKILPKWMSGWGQGNGAPPWLMWLFYYLLEYVLRRGPVPHTDSSVDREVTIKNLDLNFVGKNDKEEIYGETARPIGENWKHTRYYNQSALYQGEEEDKVLRPEWLASFLMLRFLSLLEMGYHTAKYGMVLHERIGSIQFRVNGEHFALFKIGTVLRTLEHHDAGHTFGNLPREERVAAFRAWKENALRKREERGLPV